MPKLDISICSETGMSSFVLTDENEKAKIDLMPDETADVTELARANASELKAFFSNIDSGFADKLNAFSAEELAENILNPKCGI